MYNSTLERQIALEEEMFGMGVERYRKQVAELEQSGGASSMRPAVRLMKQAIDPVSEGVSAFVEEVYQTKRGRRATAAVYLKDMDPDVVAFIALKVIFDCLTKNMMLQSCATTIGMRLNEEQTYTAFSEQNPGYFHKLSKEQSSHSRHRRAAMNHAAKRLDVHSSHWPVSDQLHVGNKLVEIIMEKTGLVQIDKRVVGKNDTRMYVVATPETMKWVEECHAFCEVLNPVYMPCIIPPKPWVSPLDGGYHTDAFGPTAFVKRGEGMHHKNYLEELSNHWEQMEPVWRSVNAMQATPWGVNPQVLQVAREIWDAGAGVAGLPMLDDHSIPSAPIPADLKKEDFTPEQKEKFIAWKRRATALYTANTKMRSKRLQQAKIIATASRFAPEEAIYFPYQLDFRGRVYSIPTYLNPQGNDLAKGLLRFAEGKPIATGEAAGWLAVHGANCFGFDKAALADRIQWVLDNEEPILRAAKHPHEEQFWMRADSPFCFLAFCFEWAGWHAEGYDFVSHLPIAMDASCSGLQHFSAMLLDPVGGKAVNLSPSEEKQDIYQTVADAVIKKLADTNTVIGAKWLGFGINRKTTKRSVMVLPYGGTYRSCAAYVEEWFEEKVTENGALDPFDDDKEFKEAKKMLAGFVWSSMSETVIAARDAMGWLQKAARCLAKEQTPIHWTTPAGFLVMQAYPEVEQQRVKTKFGDSIMKLSLRNETNMLSTRRQSQAIAPNFVHSMDASHMFLTVDLGLDNGVEHYAMIHDSFGTHACDTPMLAACIREAFVAMYEDNDVLQQFSDQVQPILTEGNELPDMPTKGDLDLSGVRDSTFFFA